MKEKCVIYVRVSTNNQDTDRQITDLQNYADRNNFTINSKFEDKISGFEDDREGLKTMMEYVIKHKISTVLVWEISRLARKQSTLNKVLEFFQTHNVNAFFLQQNVWLLENGKISFAAGLILNVMGFMSSYEATLIKDRQKSGKDQARIKGKFLGGNLLIGYDKDNEGKFKLHETFAPMVHEIFTLYANDVSSHRIISHLKEKYKDLPKSFRYVAHITRLIRNEVYKGVFPYPAIVSEELFAKAEEKRIANLTNIDKSTKKITILNKIIKCPYCGSNLTFSHVKYICKNQTQYKNSKYGKKCPSSVTMVGVIEPIIWRLARTNYLLDLDAARTNDEKAKITSGIETTNVEINLKRNQKEQLKNQRKRLIKQFSEGILTEEDIKDLVANNDREDVLIDSGIKLLSSKLNALEGKLNALNNIESKDRSWWLDIYETDDRAVMKEAIATVIRKAFWVRFGKIKVFEIEFVSGEKVHVIYKIKSDLWFKIIDPDSCVLTTDDFCDLTGNSLLGMLEDAPLSTKEMRMIYFDYEKECTFLLPNGMNTVFNYFDLD